MLIAASLTNCVVRERYAPTRFWPSSTCPREIIPSVRFFPSPTKAPTPVDVSLAICNVPLTDGNLRARANTGEVSSNFSTFGEDIARLIYEEYRKNYGDFNLGLLALEGICIPNFIKFLGIFKDENEKDADL